MGEWSGLLFDNPVVRLPAALTWHFRIPVSDGQLEIDWVPLETAGWRAMNGCAAVGTSFAEPVEAILGPHRYERVSLRISEQRDDALRVVATVSGELVGRPPLTVRADAWVRFAGISVQLSGVVTASEALGRLGEFTDVGGLAEVPDPRGIAFRFA